MAQQIVKARAPFGVDGHDFAVQDHGPGDLGQCTGEQLEAAVEALG
jgi:hypothetical protein